MTECSTRSFPCEPQPPQPLKAPSPLSSPPYFARPTARPLRIRPTRAGSAGPRWPLERPRGHAGRSLERLGLEVWTDSRDEDGNSTHGPGRGNNGPRRLGCDQGARVTQDLWVTESESDWMVPFGGSLSVDPACSKRHAASNSSAWTPKDGFFPPP